MEVAYVLINCDLGSEIETIESLKQMDYVKEIHGTFGLYDILVKIEDLERDKVRETITMKIRKLPHVRSTLTLIGIEGQS